MTAQLGRSGARPSRFRAEFSIHDTVLTRALEIGDFKTAGAILKENSADITLINDGPYERFPLNIVLVGKTSEGEQLPHNLQFANLLLSHGADPNKRVPIYDPLHGIRSSMTPIEVLVQFFYSCQKLFAFNRWEERRPDVIGLDGKVKVSFHDVRHHLLQLLGNFVDNGAKLSLPPDETGVSLLNHMLWTYPDVELVSQLVQAGVDVNCTDVHLQNAIFALCFSFAVHLRRRDLHLLQREVLSYLLRETGVQVQALNCQSQSALWVAMSVNRFDLAQMLLSGGASDEVFGFAYVATDAALCHAEIYSAEKVPAILAPYILSTSDASKKTCCEKGTANSRQNKINGHISYLVDKGYFNKPSVEDSIIELLTWNHNFKWHLKMLEGLRRKGKLVPDIFGHQSATLKQLCVRMIFKSHFPVRKGPTTVCNRDEPSNCKILFDLSDSDLRDGLETLALPLSFLPGFELELLRQKLLLTLKHSVHSWVPCTCAEDRQDSNTDSDATTDEDVPVPPHNEAVCAVVQNPLVLD